MVWGESDDDKFGPDGRYGRMLDERHATGKFAEIRFAARQLQLQNPDLTVEEAEERVKRQMEWRGET